MGRLLLLALFSAPVLGQESVPGEAYCPLAVGNAWTYKVSGQEDRLVIRAVRQAMVGEQACVLLEASLNDRVVGSEYVAFTKAGLCRYRVDKEDVSPPLCILKPVGTKGSRWRGEFALGPRKAIANFAAGVGEVAVPAGKFKTVNVTADLSEGGTRGPRTTISYAEGVGVVRQVIEDGKRPPLTLELEKFEKAPAN